MRISIFLLFIFFLNGCSNIQPRRPINPKPSTSIYTDAINQTKQINKIEEQRILKVIDRDSTNKYIRSTSGFWYTYITKINEESYKPVKGDKVVFEYEIKDLNDSIIYSKKDLGVKEYTVDKENLISGLQKGIKLMKEGETITFVIPYYNAFGVSGDNNKIGISQSIKSTITLIKIEK